MATGSVFVLRVILAQKLPYYNLQKNEGSRFLTDFFRKVVVNLLQICDNFSVPAFEKELIFESFDK